MAVFVSYAYHEPSTRPERVRDNVRLFLTLGTTPPHPTVTYHLTLQGSPAPPQIPSHVQVLSSENTGFDLGAHGKALASLDRSAFDFFVFLNCGARGPFLPTYWPSDRHWTTVFTDKLRAQSHPGIVGPSLFFHAQPRDAVVETWAFALSRAALEAVLASTSVFALHATKDAAVRHGEDTLTPFLQKHGFDVDCFLLRYQHHQPWRTDLALATPEALNHGQIPSRPFRYEGINVHPLELVFYKTHWRSSGAMDDGYECPFEQRYTQWLLDESEPRTLALPRRRVHWAEPLAREEPASTASTAAPLLLPWVLMGVFAILWLVTLLLLFRAWKK